MMLVYWLVVSRHFENEISGAKKLMLYYLKINNVPLTLNPTLNLTDSVDRSKYEIKQIKYLSNGVILPGFFELFYQDLYLLQVQCCTG